MTQKSLIVPIDVAALCVGQDDAHTPGGEYGTTSFADVAADFSSLPFVSGSAVQNRGPYLSTVAASQPMEPVATALPAGVHLHWALPDAIAHGETDGTGKLAFRNAPNRWLVVRIATPADQPSAVPSLTAWVIESDRLWDAEKPLDRTDPNSFARAVLPRVVLADGQPPPSPRLLGYSTPYESWTGDGPDEVAHARAAPLTAVGYGTPSFAAAYPHCPGVFGFWDPEPPTPASLSYAVIGWYADLDEDPLHALVPPTSDVPGDRAAAVKAAFGWSVRDGDAGTTIGGRSICSGVVRALRWDLTHKYLTEIPADLEVTIGETTAAAVAALVQSHHRELEGLETLLEAFQLGLLGKLDTPTGASGLEAALHASGFGSRTAGTVWILRRALPGGGGAPVVVDDTQLRAAASTTGDDVPADAGPALQALNDAQQSADALGFELQSLRRRVFADWQKYERLHYPSPADPIDIDVSAAHALVSQEVAAVNAALIALAAAQTAVVNASDALRVVLEKDGKGYEAAATKAPRYWRPNDPVVLITGNDARPSPRHGGDGRFEADGTLVCRIEGTTLGSLRSTGSFGTAELAAADLPALPPPMSALPELCAALVAEAIFVDPDRAPFLAAALAAKGATGGAALVDAVRVAQSPLTTPRSGMESAPGAAGASIVGTWPSPVGVNAQIATPWIPLFLEWALDLVPLAAVGNESAAQASYAPDVVSANYGIGEDDVDLHLSGPVPAVAAQSFSGSLLLAASTEVELGAQLQAYARSHPKDPNAPLLAQVADELDLGAMAQAVNGFHEALLMREQSLQLPVGDPLALGLWGPMESKFANATVRDATAGETSLAPLPLNGYDPLRAGALRLRRLRVVDAFGQARELADPKAFFSRALCLNSAADRTTGVLPPRLSQPARLLFRWRSAADDAVESNSDPATTPVCGWVVYDRLDRSLAVYDGDGTALGSLGVLGVEQGTTHWQGVPGDDQTWDKTPDEALANANVHLRDFVMATLEHPEGAAYLASMLDTIDASMTTINPLGYAQDQGLALLIGQPLALVRASLRLELAGLPSPDESWQAFAASVSAPSAPPASAGITSVRWPVRLGDVGHLDDGLIGYFVEDGTAQWLDRFQAPCATSPSHGVVPPDLSTTSLCAVASTDPSPGLTLTMLVDPRASVHATSGVLPAKEIDLPAHHYSRTLSRLAVTFLVEPLLLGPGPAIVPVPTETSRSWTWTARGHDLWEQSPQIPGTAAPSATWPHRIIEGWLRLSGPQ